MKSTTVEGTSYGLYQIWRNASASWGGDGHRAEDLLTVRSILIELAYPESKDG